MNEIKITPEEIGMAAELIRKVAERFSLWTSNRHSDLWTSIPPVLIRTPTTEFLAYQRKGNVIVFAILRA